MKRNVTLDSILPTVGELGMVIAKERRSGHPQDGLYIGEQFLKVLASHKRSSNN